MSATDRQSSERAFHDLQAGRRAASLARPEQLQFTDDTYLDHESWVRPAFDLLGEVRGLDVLDYGCGHGMAAVVLARRGARVTGLDLSAGYVREARARAEANAVAAAFVQADAERLPFAAGSFDRIWGSAILHHLDLAVAARELRRVLRPGGAGVFCEPWGGNPVLEWARRRLPYRGKERTPDEEPLRRRQVDVLRKVFPRVETRGFQLLSMARRVLPPGRVVAGLDWCDDMLLTRVPALERWCRYVVLRVEA
jgi:ubiquinone/menaquinone biosynthesis C-methylase UbiE